MYSECIFPISTLKMKRRQAGAINLASALGAKKKVIWKLIFGSFDSFPFSTDDFVISLSEIDGGMLLWTGAKEAKEKKTGMAGKREEEDVYFQVFIMFGIRRMDAE